MVRAALGAELGGFQAGGFVDGQHFYVGALSGLFHEADQLRHAFRCGSLDLKAPVGRRGAAAQQKNLLLVVDSKVKPGQQDNKKVLNHFCDSIGDDCKYRNFL